MVTNGSLEVLRKNTGMSALYAIASDSLLVLALKKISIAFLRSNNDPELCPSALKIV
jgi:hypothetical protein